MRSRGAFLSQAFSYSPGWLGSDQPFIKYLGQYFHYFPLRPPTRKPFTNEMIRPRLVYATGVRIGLARGIGGAVPRSERFFAGGSATLRGFAQNAVGPIGPNRIPIGGEAMLVLNNELRMPLVSILDGVTFVDIGNVFTPCATSRLRTCGSPPASDCASARPGSCCAATTASSSIRVPASRAGGSTSVSARRSKPRKNSRDSIRRRLIQRWRSGPAPCR